MKNHTLIFEAPLGSRLMKRFIWVQVKPLDETLPTLWWSYEKKSWVTYENIGKKGGSMSKNCHSFRSFLRHVKNHSDVLKGYKLYLVSRFAGYDIFATPKMDT